MKSSAFVLWVAFVSILIQAPFVAEAGEARRSARWAEIDTGSELPDDLARPEGKSRWDLREVVLGARWVRSVEPGTDGEALLLRTDRYQDESPRPDAVAVFEDPTGGEGALRWLLPDLARALVSSTTPQGFSLRQRSGETETGLHVEVRRVGVGWLHLPSGPHEVVLQRAVVYRDDASRGSAPDRIHHRWIDPREGIVAEVWGPASADGSTRLAAEGAALVEETLSGKADMRIYADQLDRVPGVRLAYGFDRQPDGTGNIPVSSLTPDAHVDIGDLVGAASWDFSGNTLANARFEVASSAVFVTSDETCSWDKCGFNIPGVKLGREDGNFEDPPNAEITVTATERDDDSSGVTIWLRSVVNDEGQSGGLGEGESRTCYVEDGRTPVPLWQFSNWDPVLEQWYLDADDSWSSGVFACENNIFNHVCPNSCGLFCPIYAKDCTGFSGTQSGTVVNEGPITLPSGHTFQAMLVRTLAEFCVYLFSNCGTAVDQVRTAVYLWEVPDLGTVTRLESEQVVDDVLDFDTSGPDYVVKTDIKYGLFPPLSVTIDTAATTENSVTLSWDPGSDLRIDRYNVYWNDVSGMTVPYPNFQTVTAPTTMATIGGLTKGTEYFFTVTSLSDYANPSSGILNTYESVKFPTTVPADPNPLPMEVSTTTDCIPLLEVEQLRVNKTAGAPIEFSWQASTDVCLRSYELLGAVTPELPSNFSVLDSVPAADTDVILDPTETYFLVRVGGVGASGP